MAYLGLCFRKTQAAGWTVGDLILLHSFKDPFMRLWECWSGENLGKFAILNIVLRKVYAEKVPIHSDIVYFYYF